ncbi:UDP-N-acetylmuramoyl-tripeptide--D-alanyl-D-alanine ligase [Alkalihalobacillus xiaoxiensis]|uniref:UDP-N-acetylmuramoyl-tripeptide--D-alanyl-D-alanine ligase n=1 Tax=Shouchella xiaoxiensis TaxID=766895 RepID=A0ABS2SRV2_9BACI|nr:UDP-N-acetylmuramoyl-tripeptide--D-alanyl-D-alanine ligase [Shouchella xiaoxiensis]MBM7837555.1 UDP-N-acetylmuramoyl-tripeptide--D-alanyl-D-alanine ligase [Shouchella xiaoxiensis]
MSIHSRIIEPLASRVRLTNQEIEFRGVTTDSRKRVEQALFIPLVGERFNGHHYVTGAIEAGAVASLWQEDEPVPTNLPADFQLYFVADTLDTLQQLAKVYRKQVDPFIIAITGSNGKTTTKDMVYTVLGGKGYVHKTEGNLNNHIGMPLTLLAMPSDCQFAVIEMGMNHFGEIEKLSKIAEPNAAIVTNIGEAHIEFLGSRKGIAKAKMEIVEGLIKEHWVLVDGDEPLLDAYIMPEKKSVGFGDQVSEPITDLQATESGYSFCFAGYDGWSLPMLGKHNVKNVAYAIWVAQQLGIDNEQINSRLQSLKVSGMRLEQVSGPNGSLFVNDAYNANPTSMIAAIKTIEEMTHYRDRVLVLGDIYELGTNEKELHESIAEGINDSFKAVICVGDKARWIYDAIERKQLQSLKLYEVQSVEDAAHYLKPYLNKDTVVLLKASRRLELEQVLSAVNEGGH